MKGEAANRAYARGGLILLLATMAMGLTFTEAAAQDGGINPRLSGPQRVVARDLPPPSAALLTEAAKEVMPRRVPPIRPGAAAHSTASGAEASALDASFTGGVQPMAAPTVSLLGFNGLDNDDNSAFAGRAVTPPDPQLAIGPDHILEMVNIVGRVYSKTGSVIQTFTLASLFGVPAGWRDTDPKVVYDAASGRWFASYASFIDNTPGADFGRLHLAISQSGDPTGEWNVYYLEYTDVFPDYPGIGLTDDKFTASFNLFDIDGPPITPGCSFFGGYCGEQTIVFEKAHLVAGVPGPSVGIFTFPVNLDRFTVRPAHSLSSVSDQYLATFDGSSMDGLTLIQITGTPDAGNVTEASATNLTILLQESPPNSLTAGGGSIDSGDFRLLEAVWRDGKLWGSASAACIPSGDSTQRSCAHLIEVDTTASVVTQDIMFGAAHQYFSWPAVRTDASGDLYVSLTHTNSSIFAEARMAGRLATDTLGAMSGSTLLRAGEVLHTSSRWGDYLGAAVDPMFPDCVWLVGEYAKDTAAGSDWDWGTFMAATSYDDACDGDGDRWSTADEQVIGTDPSDPCADTAAAHDETDDKWPADFDDNQDIDIVDVLALKPVFNTTVPPTSPRFDLAPDGSVDITDVLALKPVFTASCA